MANPTKDEGFAEVPYNQPKDTGKALGYFCKDDPFKDRTFGCTLISLSPGYSFHLLGKHSLKWHHPGQPCSHSLFKTPTSA